MKQLNAIIDEKIPLKHPAFVRHQVSAQGDKSDFYARDLLACVWALFGDAEHSRYLVLVPERHYADEDRTIRLYHDLHTGKWWWQTQARIVQILKSLRVRSQYLFSSLAYRRP